MVSFQNRIDLRQILARSTLIQQFKLGLVNMIQFELKRIFLAPNLIQRVNLVYLSMKEIL